MTSNKLKRPWMTLTWPWEDFRLPIWSLRLKYTWYITKINLIHHQTCFNTNTFFRKCLFLVLEFCSWPDQLAVRGTLIRSHGRSARFLMKKFVYTLNFQDFRVSTPNELYFHPFYFIIYKNHKLFPNPSDILFGINILYILYVTYKTK